MNSPIDLVYISKHITYNSSTCSSECYICKDNSEYCCAYEVESDEPIMKLCEKCGDFLMSANKVPTLEQEVKDLKEQLKNLNLQLKLHLNEKLEPDEYKYLLNLMRNC